MNNSKILARLWAETMLCTAVNYKTKDGELGKYHGNDAKDKEGELDAAADQLAVDVEPALPQLVQYLECCADLRLCDLVERSGGDWRAYIKAAAQRWNLDDKCAQALIDGVPLQAFVKTLPMEKWKLMAGLTDEVHGLVTYGDVGLCRKSVTTDLGKLNCAKTFGKLLNDFQTKSDFIVRQLPDAEFDQFFDETIVLLFDTVLSWKFFFKLTRLASTHLDLTKTDELDNWMRYRFLVSAAGSLLCGNHCSRPRLGAYLFEHAEQHLIDKFGTAPDNAADEIKDMYAQIAALAKKLHQPDPNDNTPLLDRVRQARSQQLLHAKLWVATDTLKQDGDVYTLPTALKQHACVTKTSPRMMYTVLSLGEAVLHSSLRYGRWFVNVAPPPAAPSSFGVGVAPSLPAAMLKIDDKWPTTAATTNVAGVTKNNVKNYWAWREIYCAATLLRQYDELQRNDVPRADEIGIVVLLTVSTALFGALDHHAFDVANDNVKVDGRVVHVRHLQRLFRGRCTFFNHPTNMLAFDYSQVEGRNSIKAPFRMHDYAWPDGTTTPSACSNLEFEYAQVSELVADLDNLVDELRKLVVPNNNNAVPLKTSTAIVEVSVGRADITVTADPGVPLGNGIWQVPADTDINFKALHNDDEWEIKTSAVADAAKNVTLSFKPSVMPHRHTWAVTAPAPPSPPPGGDGGAGPPSHYDGVAASPTIVVSCVRDDGEATDQVRCTRAQFEKFCRDHPVPPAHAKSLRLATAQFLEFTRLLESGY